MANMARDPVADVALLMLVRNMPDDDFLTLCARTLDSLTDTEIVTAFAREYLHTPAHGCTQLHTFCDVCGRPIGQEKLSLTCHAGVQITACKSCIDRALFKVHGPDAIEPPTREAFEDVLARMVANA